MIKNEEFNTITNTTYCIISDTNEFGIDMRYYLQSIKDIHGKKYLNFTPLISFSEIYTYTNDDECNKCLEYIKSIDKSNELNKNSKVMILEISIKEIRKIE